MKLSKLSNQTNSQDPQAVNSRIFVGNLNTFQCSKTDVERMFQIYGRLAGISMHKGYAFVQFTNPFDARNACHGEDGRTILSQTLDVNMVAEPKAHQIGRKRQNITKTGNDWDYFYDSYCSSTLFRTSGIRPKKRKRLMSTSHARMLADAVNSSSINSAVAVAQQQQHQQQLQQQQHFQQQQQQQQQHHHAHHHLQPQTHHHPQHQQQHQVAAVAMAAMANLLPQQQLLLHQQNLLTNGAANGNSNPTSPHHSLSAFLQQQQQQQHQQSAALIAAANHSSLMANGDQLSIVNNATQLLQQQHGSPQLQQQHTTSLLPLPQQVQQQPQLAPQQQQQQQQHQLQQQQQQQLQLHQSEQLTSNQHWGPYKVYSNPDTLICGNCRECFNELAELLDHKRSYCKLRFTCKCQDVALAAKTLPSSARLLCAVCKDAFNNPWDLMVHAQAAHMVNIYELGNEANNNNNNILTNNNINNSNIINNSNNNNNKANCSAAATATASAARSNVAAAAAKDTEVTVVVNNEQQQQHNNIESNAQQMSPASNNGKATLTASTTTIAAVEAKSLSNGNATPCHGDENVSDLELHCMDIKFGICSSPHVTLAKEDGHHDDASLDGRTSISSHTHHSDDVKMQNGSMSSRGSSPAMDGEEQQQPRACIVRTLSIETTTSPANSAATLGLMNGSLKQSLTNGAATLLPQ